ncbi:MAG: helix-turn-helix domain-containing protein [Oscillospiraceae bacterium]|nr:helix-turn-helix domain-containing protein [Oscillospiraceae bacterium]
MRCKLFLRDIILIFNQPMDKDDSYNPATRRQAPLQGGKPCCSRFPRLAVFYLPSLSTEQLKISIKLLSQFFQFAGLEENKIIIKQGVTGDAAYLFNFRQQGSSVKQPLSRREVADKLNISRSYVSRIEKKVPEKLRDMYE